jgi:L-asparagine transporter-like permease
MNFMTKEDRMIILYLITAILWFFCYFRSGDNIELILGIIWLIIVITNLYKKIKDKNKK